MRQHDLAGLLAAAQSRVRGARAMLARPRTCNLDECVTLFREAQGYVEWFRDSLPQAGPAPRGLRRQATVLAGEIRQAGVLLEQAAVPAAAGWSACGRRAPHTRPPAAARR
jgi:hypothetical protein